MLKEKDNKDGSHKNIWYGAGRQRIEIPKTILKSRVNSNSLLRHLHICSIGYYPKAKDHFTYRKKGLPENFLFYCVDGNGWFQIEGADGTTLYSRSGAFNTNATGQLVTVDGFNVQPAITVPSNALEVIINKTGQVFARIDGQVALQELGQLTLANFANEAGLAPLFSDEAISFRARAELLRGWGHDLPSFAEADLAATLERFAEHGFDYHPGGLGEQLVGATACQQHLHVLRRGARDVELTDCQAELGVYQQRLGIGQAGRDVDRLAANIGDERREGNRSVHDDGVVVRRIHRGDAQQVGARGGTGRLIENALVGGDHISRVRRSEELSTLSLCLFKHSICSHCRILQIWSGVTFE